MQKLYFGLDISTTTVGFSSIVIEDEKIKIISSIFYKPNKDDDLIKMLSDTKCFIINQMQTAQKEYNLEPIIAIEDIILCMIKTTAQTTTLLSAINRVLCVASYELYNKPISLLPVQTIRATIRKKAGLKGRLEKENVPKAIEKIMRKYNKKWKFEMELNRNKKPKPENYDRADAIAVALALAIRNEDL